MDGFRERVIALVIAFGMLVAAGASVRAESFDDALAGFAADSYGDTEKAIEAAAASGNPRAAIVIGALQDGRLLFNPETKKVYVKAESGTLLDAATGEQATGEKASDLKPVRINNRLRRAIEAALGSLTLLAPDPGKRWEAAQAVFRSRDAAALPALDAALAKETDSGVKRALAEARAAVILNMSGAKEADQIEAVAVIRARGDQDALGLLSALPPAASPAVGRAAKDAVAAIQNRLVLGEAAQNDWYGLMLGAYTTFVVQELIRGNNPALFGYSLAIALPWAFLVTGALGIVIERTIIRFLYGRPLETLLATWGLSLILQQAVRTTFGPTNREVGAPSWMSGAFEVGHITITYNRLWIICFSLVVFVALLGLLRFTRLGLEMRAVTQNRAMAAAVGIRTSRNDALTFGLGSGIAGIAGVALSQIDNVSPNLGRGYIIDSFMVVVFGGVGNLWGTLVGAFSLGIVNKILEPFAGAVVGKIIVLVLIILFIQKRPRGLFALKGRAVEA